MERAIGFYPIDTGSTPVTCTWYFEKYIWGCSGFDWGLKVVNSHGMICTISNQPINLNDNKIVKFPIHRAYSEVRLAA